MTTATLEKEKINTFVKRVVIDLFQDMVSDPDRGLDLQDWVKERLRRFDSDKPDAGLVSLQQIKRKFS